MLKLRFILTSALILLLVGLDMNVRAAIDSNKVSQESTEKDPSEKDSEEHEPTQSFKELDFFGAFSLVNIQLQWRDLHVGLNDEITDVESSINPIGLSLAEVEKVSLDESGQIVPPSPIITTSRVVVPVTRFRVISGKTHFKVIQNKQSANTIAYIQNCSTYPRALNQLD